MPRDFILLERKMFCHVSESVKSGMCVSGVTTSPPAHIIKHSLRCYLQKELMFVLFARQVSLLVSRTTISTSPRARTALLQLLY